MKEYKGFQSKDAYSMFMSSGSVGMYLMYKALKEDEEKESRALK